MISRVYIVCVAMLCLTACRQKNAEEYYQQGRSLRAAGEPVAAMQAFLSATQVRSGEYGIKGRSYSNMATMCRICEQHETAYRLYECSAVQFRLAGDSMAYAYALNNMAWEQAVSGHKNEAVHLADSALGICNDPAVQLKLLATRAAACLYADEPDSVLYYTQKALCEKGDTIYLTMLQAQAYSFLEQSDSASACARRVLQRTDNPRYTDDAYYILIQHDSTASGDELRARASARSDVQRSLERNSPEWAEAVRMAEAALQKAGDPSRAVVRVLWCMLCAGGAVWLLYQVIRRHKAQAELDRQCRILRHSPRLKEELQWDDYEPFCSICDARLCGIVSKLRSRGLHEREIRMSVLFLIGLSYAEIARVLYRAESGIGKDKYMIAKHLGVSVKNLQNTLREIAGSVK